MTGKRKAALQWVHDRGEVRSFHDAPFSSELMMRMEREGQLQWRNPGAPIWSLTDAGRQALHEATP